MRAPPFVPIAAQPVATSRRRHVHYVYATWGLLAMAAVHAALHIAYGDAGHALANGLLVAASLCFVYASQRLSPRAVMVSGGVTASAAVLLWATVWPLGPTAISLHLPLALMCASLTRHVGRGVLVWCAVTALTFAYNLSDLPKPAAPTLPELYGMLATMAVTLSLAWLVVEQRVGRIRDRLAEIHETEAALHTEDARLREAKLALGQLNQELSRSARRLCERATEEERLTAELSARVGDEASAVAAIHRDLLTPLRVIRGRVDRIQCDLAADAATAKAASYLGFAADACGRMEVMLADLLRYTEQRDEPTEHVCLRTLAEELRVDLANALGRSGGELVVSDDLPTVSGYPTQLRQLLQNLLANALKFARPGVAPRVELRWTGGRLEVADNGIGIPRERLGEVFGLFNRVHESGGYEGSGVGLALCRRIALAHDFGLTCESEVGHGSAFHIGIPAAYVRTQGSGAPLPSPRHLDARLTAATSPA